MQGFPCNSFCSLQRRVSMNTGVSHVSHGAIVPLTGCTGVREIDELDLGPIKVKLMRQDGEEWSRDHVQIVEKEYKKFLFLNLKYPFAKIVPTKSIDTFWHYHILDTMKYTEDCQKVFGYFLHHFPYFGVRGEQDEKDHKKAVLETKKLLLQEFGELSSEQRSSFADCNGEAICTGDPDKIHDPHRFSRPVFC